MLLPRESVAESENCMDTWNPTIEELEAEKKKVAFGYVLVVFIILEESPFTEIPNVVPSITVTDIVASLVTK